MIPLFDIPILDFRNESDTQVLDILIEPHLELYQLLPGKFCTVYYFQPPDNRIPEKTLEIAYRDDCIVIYPPGEYSPVLKVDGVTLQNIWA